MERIRGTGRKYEWFLDYIQRNNVADRAAKPRASYIDIAGAYNVRDLGGYPTVDGRATRRGHFIRADRLSALPAQAQKTLCDYGVRTVVDLRTSNETKQWPCTFANHPTVDYRRHNLEGDDLLPGYDLGDKHRSLFDSYLVLLDIRGDAVRDVFATLADSSRLPVVFFCAGGTPIDDRQ